MPFQSPPTANTHSCRGGVRRTGEQLAPVLSIKLTGWPAPPPGRAYSHVHVSNVHSLRLTVPLPSAVAFTGRQAAGPAARHSVRCQPCARRGSRRRVRPCKHDAHSGRHPLGGDQSQTVATRVLHPVPPPSDAHARRPHASQARVETSCMTPETDGASVRTGSRPVEHLDPGRAWNGPATSTAAQHRQQRLDTNVGTTRNDDRRR
jgi:hypothetical protein